MEWGGALPKVHPTENPRGGASPPHYGVESGGRLGDSGPSLGWSLSDQICLVWGAAGGIFADGIT